MRTHILALSLAAVLAACSPDPAATPESAAPSAAATLDGSRPLVIAHRGASGERPEHTIAAYELAIAQGADCIEPDLVMTKDGVLVDRHDIYLSTTTDVADHPEFADRKRASPDPGHDGAVDWWVADFTLAELKTLRARQPFKGRSKEYDGQFDIPTFDEVLDLTLLSKAASGAPMCVYPEAKAPAFHASLGFDMVDAIERALTNKWMGSPSAPVFIQSFEPDFVRAMHARGGHKVVLLAGSREDYDHALSLDGAPFWDGAGVTHQMLFNADGTSSGLIEAAHAQGVVVHAWTYRDDAPFKDAPIGTSMNKALDLGLDGLFTDFPATGVKVVGERASQAASSN